jgi:hypothetical protein
MLENLLQIQEREIDVVEGSPCVVEVYGREVGVDEKQYHKVASWVKQGFSTAMLTPAHTIVFVTPEQSEKILHDQRNCSCCLSACRFSSWCQHKGSTGKIPDPRSFCIQKSLQAAAHGGDLDQNLVFAGHCAYRFGEDPFYGGNFIPSTEQLVNRIMTGY